MRAVLISIQPQWCKLIASGKKTIEVRKTKPKLDTPFKVYIYCTKPRHYYKISRHLLTSDESLFLVNGKVRMCDGFGVEYEDSEYKHLNCKVIGEFVCNKVDRIAHCGTRNNDIRLRLVDENLYCKDLDSKYLNKCKLSHSDIEKYSNGGDVYGWHISDLVIYDKPRELRDFRRFGVCPCSAKSILHCTGNMSFCAKCNLTRPPQSWCYVEKGA